jgi:hypothetical protein
LLLLSPCQAASGKDSRQTFFFEFQNNGFSADGGIHSRSLLNGANEGDVTRRGIDFPVLRIKGSMPLLSRLNRDMSSSLYPRYLSLVCLDRIQNNSHDPGSQRTFSEKTFEALLT